MNSTRLRLLATLLAVFTSLIALGVLIVASLLDRDAGIPWTVAKVAAGTFILAAGAVTMRPRWSPRLAAAASAIVVPLGGLMVIGTARLAMLTGDMEWYMAIAGLALMCQGCLGLQPALPSPVGERGQR